MSKTTKANLMLIVTVLIWGTAFVAQKVGGEIGCFTFGAVRMTIGALVLLPVAIISNKAQAPITKEEKKRWRKSNLIGGLCCGLALCSATTFQQFGLMYTTVSKSGFITALYVVFVPLCGLVAGKKVAKKTWACVGLAIVGFYFLCLFGENVSLEFGDILMLCCAASFTAHILVIDHFSPKCNGVTITCIQFAVCAVINGAGMLIFEEPKISEILNCYFPILYTGVISCGIAYTFQTFAQRNAKPTQATLIMSMEAVVSAIGGAIFLNEKLTLVQYVACFIILVATTLANLPERKQGKLE